MKKNAIIKARYQDGVLRPLKKLDLQEGTVVELVIEPEDPRKSLQELMRKVRARNRHIPPEEIERDIEQALREVREENRKTLKTAGRSR